MRDTQQPITINTVIVIRILAGITVFLVLASAVSQLARFLGGYDSLYGLVRMFFLDEENNIPTFFSSGILLLSACLLAVIAVLKKRERDSFAGYWTALAIIFLLLSMDEASSTHELLTSPLRYLLHTSKFFYFAWVIPGLAFVLTIAIIFWRFLTHLPMRTRRLFVVAGIVYIAGVIGTELVAGWYVELYTRNNLTYSFLAMLEETLEIIGVIVFIYALLDYMTVEVEEVRFRVRSNST